MSCCHKKEGRPPAPGGDEEDPCQPRVGWQKKAGTAIEASQAMLRSQRGPLANIAFTSFPSDRSARFDSAPFRVLLLRRLRVPPPLTVRSCRCSRPLDAFGHHHAACATAGVLGRKGWVLESAAARVCREGGARVRTNVFVRAPDGRRLEVVVDGRPLFGGSQLAIETTMVSPLHTDGSATPKIGKPWRRPTDAKARTLSLLEKG